MDRKGGGKKMLVFLWMLERRRHTWRRRGGRRSSFQGTREEKCGGHFVMFLSKSKNDLKKKKQTKNKQTNKQTNKVHFRKTKGKRKSNVGLVWFSVSTVGEH